MKRIIAFLAGSVALTMSLPTLAGVSHVFVSNTGDQTLSLIRCVTANGENTIKCEEEDRMEVGFGTSWPANQYDGHPAWWWSGLGGEVIGVKARASLSPLKDGKHIATVDTYDLPGAPVKTGSRSNFIGISPDGRTAWNSAREIDEIQEINTDPDHPDFGTITQRIPVPDFDPSSGPSDRNGAARPCDATITPDGRFFMEPDLGGESLTIVDTVTKQIIHQVLPPLADGSDKVLPFMATTNGKIVLVENLELDNTYDVWDVSDLPDEPIHLKKITQADGLGVNAQTSEFTPNGRSAYLIMNGVENAASGSPDASRLDVLDVMEGSGTYLEIVNSIELPHNCGAHTGDFSNDGRYFFVNCQRIDELVVVDSETETAVASIPVGDRPRGVIVR
jgi:YVTN family beta-propeller protein